MHRSTRKPAPSKSGFGAQFAFSAFATLPGSADNLPIQVPRDLVPVGYLGGAPMFHTARVNCQ